VITEFKIFEKVGFSYGEEAWEGIKWYRKGKLVKDKNYEKEKPKKEHYYDLRFECDECGEEWGILSKTICTDECPECEEETYPYSHDSIWKEEKSIYETAKTRWFKDGKLTKPIFDEENEEDVKLDKDHVIDYLGDTIKVTDAVWCEYDRVWCKKEDAIWVDYLGLWTTPRVDPVIENLNNIDPYGEEDWNEDDLKVGDRVLVPDPIEDDNYNHSFQGHITCFYNGYAIVEDQLGDQFSIEPERLVKIYESIWRRVEGI
jgi:hypothetical protein